VVKPVVYIHHGFLSRPPIQPEEQIKVNGLELLEHGHHAWMQQNGVILYQVKPVAVLVLLVTVVKNHGLQE
jgi:hypothetical protein